MVDQQLEAIYTELQNHQCHSVDERVAFLSRYFLNSPYLLGAQGEGDLGEFDQNPLYRFDGFDCVTYVNDILALALSDCPENFLPTLLQLSYYDANPIYENRFHFMSCDWNLQNQQNGFVKDITGEIGGELVQCAIGDIDKPNWYRFQQKPVPKKTVVERASINYLPLDALFEQPDLLLMFPRISIIEIVRPNWDLRQKIGTQLHVSHLGFCLHEKNKLFFRHASSEQKKVVEVPLSDYLKHCMTSPTIKGVNVQVLVG